MHQSTQNTGLRTNRKITNESYVLLFDKFTKDSVAKAVDDQGLELTNKKGEKLSIGNFKTKSQRRRANSLRQAQEIVEEHISHRHPKPNVSLDWTVAKGACTQNNAARTYRQTERKTEWRTY